MLFASRSSNLVVGDDSGQDDLFLRDLAAGTTVPVAANLAGAPAGAVNGAMSADGTVVTFLSDANDLVPGVDDGAPLGGGDAYVRNMTTGVTSLVSVTTAGKASNDAEGLDISGDGTRVTFNTMAGTYGPTDTNQRDDIYVRDLAAGTTALVTANAAGTDAGNSDSMVGRISPDGRWVTFESDAKDLGPTTGDGSHTFVRDLASGTTAILSRSAAGDDGTNFPTFSPDSSRVAFTSWERAVSGPSHSEVYVRDLRSGELTLVSTGPDGTTPAGGVSLEPAFDPSGTRVAFVSDAAGTDPVPGYQVYVRDLVTGVTTLVSGNPDGTRNERGRALKPAIGPGVHVAYRRQGSGTDLRLATLHGAALATTLEVAPGSVPSGGQASVTVTAGNDGPDAADDVRAGVLVPAGATVTAVTGPGDCTTAPAGDGTLATCTVASLAPGGSVEVAVTVEVTAAASTTLDLLGGVVSPTVDAGAVPGGRLAGASLVVA